VKVRYNHRFRSLLSSWLCGWVLFVGFADHAFGYSPDFSVSRIEWAIVLDEIIIDYDVVGEPDDEYNVALVLLRRSDKEFRFTPRLVKGNIGKGQTAGTNKQIRWSYRSDLLTELHGDDYFFEITIEKLRPFPWVMVATGAALGGLLTFLLTSSGEKPPAPPELPYPPVRP
jgi:hypothetical protein